jgi:hypothetical protein
MHARGVRGQAKGYTCSAYVPQVSYKSIRIGGMLDGPNYYAGSERNRYVLV